MKREVNEFIFDSEVGRDRPSSKYSGPFGSGESHGDQKNPTNEATNAIIGLLVGIAGVVLLVAIIAAAAAFKGG